MALDNWDPLEGSLPSEVVSATIKRQIKNILKSYTGWFDPFSELLQNALDAVENRRRRGDDFKPSVWIEINLQENALSVTDNGIGFSEDQFKSFLAPNVSFKKQQNRGNKGVGATYVGYGFNYLRIGTKSTGFQFIGTLENGREWVEDEQGVVTRPKMSEDELALVHDAFTDVDNGTTFTLKLIGEHVRPKRLDWIGATTAEQWEAILRVKTPLGGIYASEASPLAHCELRVVDEQGKTTAKVIESATYLYPHIAISTCARLGDIKEAQAELIRKGRDVSRLADRFFRLNGLYDDWTYNDFVDKGGEFGGKLTADQKELAQRHKVRCYGFFCYSTDIWDYYNDKVLKIRRGERILRGGLQLGTNAMPQGDLIQIPLTRNIGYQNTSHVVVHFDGAEPDLGRKGFQPELEELGKTLAALIVNSFLGWRKHLKKETGTPPDIIGKKNIHDWIREQEAHEQKHPLVITRADLFLPIMEPAITSTPLNEQDVVALFNQFLAGGVIRGVKLMSASTHNQYDGVYRFVLREPLANHIFDVDSNPLGVERTQVTAPFESDPRILEYKYSFDALVEEFEKEVKREREIGLVVAWEMGKDWQSRFDITPLLHLDNVHHRYFHGGTHIMKSALTGDVVFPAIILRELVDFINDPAAVQDYQQRTYLDL